MKGRRAARSRTPFYAGLALIALAGAAAIAYVATKPSGVTVTSADSAKGPAGPAQPYVLGADSAPVKVLEFADFECPACGNWSVVTEPDVRKRLIETGRVQLSYYDYPLPMHRNTWFASNAAACADEQQKFWPYHDRLFLGQNEWNGETTRNPKSVLEGYAKELGLDVARWTTCFDARKYEARVRANAAEAERRFVNQTPSFVIGGKLVTGGASYDDFKRMVDAAAAAAPAPAIAAPAAGSDTARRAAKPR